jgi:hypothetical protein
MEHVPTKVEETNEEKRQPIAIESKRIPLGYLAKDGYYYETKEEALAATNKEAMVNQILAEIQEGSCDIQSVLDAINRTRAAKLIKRVVHNAKTQSEALIKKVIDKAKKAVLVNRIIRDPEAVQCWRNSRLKKLTPITIAPTEQATPRAKRYVTGSSRQARVDEYFTRRPTVGVNRDNTHRECTHCGGVYHSPTQCPVIVT